MIREHKICKGFPALNIQCGRDLPNTEEFFNKTPNPRVKGEYYLKSMCKVCQADYNAKKRVNEVEKYKVRDKEKYERRKEITKNLISVQRSEIPDKFRNYEYQKKYGITIDEYNKMDSEQNSVCKICMNPETSTRDGKVLRLSVDHCHRTGVIRGLLCRGCNTSIGELESNCELTLKDKIIKTAKYLGIELTEFDR